MNFILFTVYGLLKLIKLVIGSLLTFTLTSIAHAPILCLLLIINIPRFIYQYGGGIEDNAYTRASCNVLTRYMYLYKYGSRGDEWDLFAGTTLFSLLLWVLGLVILFE